jgi:hypothetical protein
MDNGSQWLVKDDSGNYLIEFVKIASNGQAQVKINGVPDQYFLADVDGDHYGTVLPCGRKKCLLQVNADHADLYVDGELQSRLPPSGETQTATATVSENSILQRKIKSGMGSFLTLIILSVLNNILIWVNAPISFPFSIYASLVAFIFGQQFSDEFGKPVFLIAGVAFSILVIGVYFVLYMLARKRTWPVWIAFGLILADTLLLIIFIILNQGEYLFDFVINLAFHAWIIWSLVQLGKSRAKLKKLVRSQIEGQPVAAI